MALPFLEDVVFVRVEGHLKQILQAGKGGVFFGINSIRMVFSLALAH